MNICWPQERVFFVVVFVPLKSQTLMMVKIFIVTECGPQDKVQVQEGPTAVRRAQRRGDQRQYVYHEGAGPEVRQGPGRGIDNRAAQHIPRHDIHD